MSMPGTRLDPSISLVSGGHLLQFVSGTFGEIPKPIIASTASDAGMGLWLGCRSDRLNFIYRAWMSWKSPRTSRLPHILGTIKILDPRTPRSGYDSIRALA